MGWFDVIKASAPSLMALSAAMAALIVFVGLADQSSAQDVSRGARLFTACEACHAIDSLHRTGPRLSGIIGRKAGTMPDFRYSRAMRNANVVWTEETLDRYMASPQSLIPGNLMPFAGLADAKDRADLIAYLATLR